MKKDTEQVKSRKNVKTKENLTRANLKVFLATSRYAFFAESLINVEHMTNVNLSVLFLQSDKSTVQ